MSVWHIHFLNARNDLTAHMADIRDTARQAVATAQKIADIPRFDLVIRGQSARPVPDWGPAWPVSGSLTQMGVIQISLHPGVFSKDHLLHVLLRQMHHLMRAERPVRDPSLGDALVSEGLASHFTQHLLGCGPAPWDLVKPSNGALRQAANAWAYRDIDYAQWFQGRGALRKGTGFGLGYHLVAQYVAQETLTDQAELIGIDADAFRPALRRLLASEQIHLSSDEEKVSEIITDTEIKTQAGLETPPSVLTSAL